MFQTNPHAQLLKLLKEEDSWRGQTLCSTLESSKEEDFWRGQTLTFNFRRALRRKAPAGGQALCSTLETPEGGRLLEGANPMFNFRKIQGGRPLARSRWVGGTGRCIWRFRWRFRFRSKAGPPSRCAPSSTQQHLAPPNSVLQYPNSVLQQRAFSSVCIVVA